MILPDHLKKRDDESFFDYKVRLCIAKLNKEIDLDWIEIKEILGLDCSSDHLRKLAYAWKEMLENDYKPARTKTNEDTVLSYKEKVEILGDGSHKSDKLLRMSAEQCKDPEFLLKAHGYDNSEWELVNAKNNIWNVYSKQDGIQTLYSSRITVKPKKSGFNMDKIIEAIKNVKPIHIDTKPFISEKHFLEIPFLDTHFGVSDYEYYKQTQFETIELIKSKKWKEILFVIGQDMLHNNDFRGNTANGTSIQVVDMAKAWEDACKFYEPIIEEAIKQSEYVKIMYSKGNHDESISWAFVKYLKARFPQTDVDDSIVERKAHTFGRVFIGITHGDKAAKELHNIFPVEFPLEWANSTVREIHKGHLHKEDAKDVFGTMVRTLSTRNKTDKWHKDNGYVGAHKRFMLFEYSEDALKKIHYV
jgi:hypothetical protein